MIGAGSRRVPLYAILAASAVSLTGNTVALLAIPWFVLETTGSAALTGITAAANVLPTVISGAFGGVVVDRLGHRRASVVSDLASAGTVAAIPLLHLTVGIEFWQLIVLVFLGALLDLPGGSARLSLMPELAEGAGMPLERANALWSGIGRAAQMGGPLLAGALIAAVGPATALWANAGAFVVAALLVAALVPRPERPRAAEPVSYLGQLRLGIRVLSEDRLLRTVLVIVAVSNLMASPVFAVALPVYANRILASPVALGVLNAALGAGALAGTLLYGAWGSRVPGRATLIGAFSLSGVPLAALAVIEDVALGAAILALVGLASAPLNPLILTAVQKRTPANMRAQVIGTVVSLAWIAMPVGMLIAGSLAEALGVRVLFLIAGGAFAILFLAMLPVSALEELDVRREVDSL